MKEGGKNATYTGIIIGGIIVTGDTLIVSYFCASICCSAFVKDCFDILCLLAVEVESNMIQDLSAN